MALQDRTVEQILARIATSEHGVVTWAEMRRAGISADEIRHRARIGSLIRTYRGIYRVGHRAPSVEARYLAAVRACGDWAVLSGRSAGYLLGIIKGKPPPPEVTAPTQRRVEGLKTHRCRGMDAREVTTYRGIPVTTVPRTLVDLAATLSLGDLARACHEAGVLHRTTPRQVERVLARRSSCRGARKLRQVLHGEIHVTLSTLERRFLELLRAHGLPLPMTNRVASAHRVDCRWPEHQLTVELDSYRFHNSRHSWEGSYRREREAHGREDRFRRFTWADVTEDPRYMLGELRKLLSVTSPALAG
jgi:predicted transcriptional regulator of viral defense system